MTWLVIGAAVLLLAAVSLTVARIIGLVARGRDRHG